MRWRTRSSWCAARTPPTAGPRWSSCPPAGAREAEQALEPRLDAMAELFEDFSAAEQQAFAEALVRLGQAIQARQDAC